MRKPISIILSIFALLGVISTIFLNGKGDVGAAQAPKDPPIYFPVIMNSITLPPADEATRRITVPPGFAIRIFASGLLGPRLMALGPDGQVYVALPSSGQIARLPDRNRDGLADEVEIVASGLTTPHNMEWFNGAMYVAEIGRVDRLTDTNNDGIYETRQLITSNIPGSDGHSSRTLHFGPDGKLYVSAGSTCNNCIETDPRRAAILRFNPDGSIPNDNPFRNDPDSRKQAVWAYGLRNSVDFLWTPGGALWADHNGSDGLGDNAPPEEIIIPVQAGKSHGWPYCYTGILGLNMPAQSEVRDTRVSLPAGFTCADAVPALFTAPAHSAPLGMAAATHSKFPAEYRDDIFVAYHGSWDTTNPADYRDCKVERIIVQNGAVTGSETFANGWRAPDALCRDSSTWGRPAGLVFGADGALYISDDTNRRVYRVVYTGQ